MLTRFDEDAQKAIVTAESIAFDFGCNFTETWHLLLSMLKQTNQKFTKELNKSYIDYETLYDECVRLFDKKDDTPFFTEYSEDMKSVLDRTVQIMKNKHQSKATFNMLAIALLEHIESVGIALLKSSYLIDTDELKRKLNQSNPKEFSQKSYQKLKTLLKDKEITYATILNPSKQKIVLQRDKEVQDILVGLCCFEKSNIALTGFAGVGKTAVVEELARVLRYENKVPHLKDYCIVQLNVNSTVAGTRYRGDFEEKIQKYLDVIKNQKVITFIDEGHTMLTAGKCEESTALSDILKPILARRGYKFIIATTNDEYKMIERDAAMARRFRNIPILEPNIDNVKDMIENKVEKMSQYHKVKVSTEDIESVISASQSIPQRYFPDKAIDVIDYTMSYAEVFHNGQFDVQDAFQYIEQLSGVNPDAV